MKNKSSLDNYDLRRFWGFVNKTKTCWLWNNAESHKYGTFRHSGNRITAAHRMSYEIHNGPIESGMNVCHKCDNCACVRPSHLFLGDDQTNIRDMLSKGRGRGQSFSSRHFKSNKLTFREAEIAAMISCGLTNKQIANEIKRSVKTVEKHRGAIYHKINTNSPALLAHFCISTGLAALISPTTQNS